MTAAILGGAFLAGIFIGWPAVPLLGAIAILAVLLDDRRIVIACGVVVLASLGAWRAPDDASFQFSQTALSQQPVRVASGVVRDTRYQLFEAEIGGIGRVCSIAYGGSEVGRGDHLVADIDLRPLNALGPGLAASMRSRGCVGSATISNITIEQQGSGPMRWIDNLRNRAAGQLEEWVPGDRGALLSGLVIGDDARLSDDVAEAFLDTGTFHIVAISGANLTLLIALLAVLTIWLPRPWSEIVPLLMVWAYVLVAGAGPPTVRAGMLALVVLLGRFRGRPIDLLTLTVLVAAVQAAIWPEVTLGLSFRLSTVAMLVVMLVSFEHLERNWRNSIWTLALTSFAVNAALMPILPVESRAALVPAVLANVLIAVPVALAFAIGLAALLIGTVSPPFGQSLAIIAGEINGLTIAIVQQVARLDALPGWMVLDFSEATQILVLLFAVLSVIACSRESRRWIGDGVQAAALREDSVLPMAWGIGAGAILAIVVIVIIG